MLSFIKSLFLAGSNKTDYIQINNFVDYHSHILPGVDDGIRTLSDSLAVLNEYEKLGVSEVWLTPHIMEDYPNTTESLRTRFSELKEAYKGKVILHLASENMMDELFLERLESNDLLPLNDKFLLVETSYFNPPNGLSDILEKIFEKGYTPVLAHPERYTYMSKDNYENVLDRGIKMQLNLLSLSGFYGKYAQQKALALAEYGAYSYVGTDLHNISQTRQLKSIFKSHHLSKFIEGIAE